MRPSLQLLQPRESVDRGGSRGVRLTVEGAGLLGLWRVLWRGVVHWGGENTETAAMRSDAGEGEGKEERAEEVWFGLFASRLASHRQTQPAMQPARNGRRIGAHWPETARANGHHTQPASPSARARAAGRRAISTVFLSAGRNGEGTTRPGISAKTFPGGNPGRFVSSSSAACCCSVRPNSAVDSGQFDKWHG